MTILNNQRKIAILTLLILAINLFMPIISSAETATTVFLKIEEGEKEYYEAGDEITVALSTKDLVPDGSGLTGTILFDNEKLGILNPTSWKIVNTEGASFQSGLNDAPARNVRVGSVMTCGWDPENPNSIIFAVETIDASVRTEGQILLLYFKVKEGATGTATLGFVGGNSGVKYGNFDNQKSVEANGEKNYPVTVGENIVLNLGTKPIPLESISVSPTEKTLGIGESQKLAVTYSPEDTTDDKAVTWSSSDTKVATVDTEGNVTAVAPGSATITAKVGTLEARATITVTSALTKIAITPSNTINLEPNAEQELEIVYTPNNTTDSKAITWSSSNTSVATVESTGEGTAKVTAVANGEATITAKSAVTGVEDATVTVKVSTKVTSIKLDKETGTLNKGEDVTLNLTINPENASVKDIKWTSSDDSIASVEKGTDSKSAIVKCLKGGNATITVTVTDETTSYTATYKLEVKVPLNSISIGEDFELLPQQTKDLAITYNPEDTTDAKTATWESSNTKIATVDQGGKVTAIAPGEATIKATVAGKEATCKVTVPEVKIQTVSLNKTETTINKGENETLNVIINPTNTTDDTTATWESSNTKIATVDQEGKVTAIAPGEATIKATVAGKEATCKVTVVSPLKDITLSKTKVTLKKGVTGEDTETITVTYNPEDTTDDRTVTWTSKNQSVATVDQEGKITAVAGGSAVIEAKVGNITKTVDVTVEVPLKGISLNKQSLEINKKASETLTVTYNPEDTTDDKTVVWSSSDESIAKVDSNGKITGVKEGKATITAKVGEFSATAEVTVKEIKLAGIAIDNKKEVLYKNETLDLKIILNPENTTDDVKIIWSSSDDTIAKIDSNGKVTALKEGKVTITAKVDTANSVGSALIALLGSSGNELEDSFEIEVKEVHTESIELSTENEDNQVIAGENLKINVNFFPSNTTDSKELIYASSDESIATVDENGNIKGIAPGTVTITAMTANGIKSQITVTITEPEEEPEVDNGSISKTADSPKTGDINIALYISLMVISLIGIIVQIKKNK